MNKFINFKFILNKQLIIFVVLIFFVAQFSKANAAGSALIYVSPSAGNYNVGQIFTADVIIDGAGTVFNAAKADVSVSTNLVVKDLTLGDCDFAFIKTPTANMLSFVGVILGGSSSKCTVYKLTLQVIRTGQGYITLANGSVKSYPKALEIFSSSKNSTFALSPSSNNQQAMSNLATPQSSETPQNNLSFYNIILNIKNENGASVPGALVNVEYQGLEKNQSIFQSLAQTTNATGTVEFTNIPKGVYKIKAVYQGKVLAENILNVGGTSKSIILGIQAKQTFNPIWIIILLIVIFVAVAGIVIYKKRNNLVLKKNNIQENNL